MSNSNTDMSVFARTIMDAKYAHVKEDGTKESWEEIAERVARSVLGAVKAPERQILATAQLIAQRKFIPGGRYLFASGNPFHQVQNCVLTRAEDSREGWSDHLHKGSMALMTGAGLGTGYSLIRPENYPIRRTGGRSTGPLALMHMSNECGRFIMQGGSRRSAIWAGLNWAHPDIHKFIRIKDWSDDIRAMKEKDFNFPAPMDGTNVSVQLDDDFFDAYHQRSCPNYKDPHPELIQGYLWPERNEPCVKCGYSAKAHYWDWAKDVYWQTVRHMLESAEPGFSIDCGPNAGEDLRNACTEVTSFDDSDICNLGSINMSRIDSLGEMLHVVRMGTAFLLAGTVYSDIPYEEIGVTREKNRRLGLGLMGLHEWMLKRGLPYGPSEELARFMTIYATSGLVANEFADLWGLSHPIKTRAIAPTGTIGIVGETTTGIEPVFCVAFKRRYLEGKHWTYQYVIDPAAARLIASGIDPGAVEDAYTLAKEPERRVAFQAWLQQYVDHAISSTLNLPQWGSEHNNEGLVNEFGDMLMRYLPQLRGITCYPDGARGGQPLTPVHYATAIKHVGQIFYESQDICDISKGGSCGV